MTDFTHILVEEQQPVNEALQRAIGRLPASVRPVAEYGMMAGGKRLRPLLSVMVSRLFQPRIDDPYALGAVLEMIHVATLLHDDILDEAETRRGRPAAHVNYGVSAALLAGDALMAEASRIVAGYGIPAMVECVADAIVHTVAGEAREIALQRSLDHDLETYYDIIRGKTAWLLRASCRLPALHAGADSAGLEAISQYGLNLGMAFQMVDDALDFADEAVTGKPTGGDLREGKFTPPVALYLEALEPARRAAFAEKFTSGMFTDEEVASIAGEIRAQGFDAQVRQQANCYLDKAAAALDTTPDRPERAMLRQALDYVRDRKK